MPQVIMRRSGFSAASRFVYQELREAGINEEQSPRLFNLLIWFGFFGIVARDVEDRYACRTSTALSA